VSVPRKDIDPGQLKLRVAELIGEEQGKPVGLIVAKNLPMLPTETSWSAVEFIFEQRSSLFDVDGEPDRERMEAFTEGLLCGLRLRAAVGELLAP